MDSHRNKTIGKHIFEEFLCEIGSAATSRGFLSDFRAKGRYFLVPITTGTSFKAACFSAASMYGVRKLTLPALDCSDTEKLAIEFLKLRHPKLSDIGLRKIVSDSLFRVSLADTAGLPGLIRFLCDAALHSSYVEYLMERVTSYISLQVLADHWGSLTTIALARPRMWESRVIESTYTVHDAVDSGTVFYDQITHEIRLAPVLLACYNDNHGLFSPLVLKHISRAEEWTWQDFGKSHALYLSATMMALKREEQRFEKITLGTFEKITLGTLLRHVKPQDNAHLKYRLILSSDEEFNGKMFKRDTHQCIDTNRGTNRHTVDTECFTSIRLVAPVTPLIDAYLNLQLERSKPSGVNTKIPTTLFIQYKYTSLQTHTSQIKVSVMNTLVEQLSETLAAMEWEQSRNWLILWVSNRPILEDVLPHSKLLWVGQDDLE